MSYVNTCGKCRGLGFAICHCATGGHQGLGGSSTSTAYVRFCPDCGQLIYDNMLHFCRANTTPLPFSDEEPAPEPWVCPVCRCGVRGDVERCPCRAEVRGGPLRIDTSSTYKLTIANGHIPFISGGGGTEGDLDEDGDEGDEAP
jgi:hypothetical protein